ncbi:hypothetical protein HDE_04495 [Halotydeus destructor]|nr:hypothetical protein HDE_04495 [Halotydeus destructor]
MIDSVSQSHIYSEAQYIDPNLDMAEKHYDSIGPEASSDPRSRSNTIGRRTYVDIRSSSHTSSNTNLYDDSLTDRESARLTTDGYDDVRLGVRFNR